MSEAGCSEPELAGDEPAVHNDGASPVVAWVVVAIPGEGNRSELVGLEPGHTCAIEAPAEASVEVHTGTESATAPAAPAPLFVLREGRLIVAPW